MVNFELQQKILDPSHDHAWAQFRAEFFPSERLNLNTATLGNRSQVVKKELSKEWDELTAFPLGQYMEGRDSLIRCRELVSRLWPSSSHSPCIGLGTTQTMSLLANSLCIANSHKKLRVCTTNFEHEGGISAFEQHQSYEIDYLDSLNLDRFKGYLEASKPEVIFISHVFYANGLINEIKDLYQLAKQTSPDSLFIVDVAQSLGVLELPLDYADIMVGSFHKWMFGPTGTGVVWINKEIMPKLAPFFIGGDSLDREFHGHGFEMAGGQNFVSYLALEAALKLYETVGQQLIAKRCHYLSSSLVESLSQWTHNLTNVKVSPDFPAHPGIIAITIEDHETYKLYTDLNNIGMHVKYIADKNLIRVSVPYYETRERLYQFSKELKKRLCSQT